MREGDERKSWWSGKLSGSRLWLGSLAARPILDELASSTDPIHGPLLINKQGLTMF
jgi:hypothetical protein